MVWDRWWELMVGSRYVVPSWQLGWNTDDGREAKVGSFRTYLYLDSWTLRRVVHGTHGGGLRCVTESVQQTVVPGRASDIRRKLHRIYIGDASTPVASERGGDTEKGGRRALVKRRPMDDPGEERAPSLHRVV